MRSRNDIAVIGMSGRFPGAPHLAAFWRNLRDGAETITFFPHDELAAAGIDSSVLRNPCYVNAGSVLEDVDLFDAAFFGVNPREAESMDPQQRLFMECAWHAIEDAGYDPEDYDGSIGVFAGCAMSTYLSQLQRNPLFVELVGFLQTLVGNDKDYLTTHVSYKFNLTGPSVTIQSTCSTSLVAICVACQSLLSRQCDMALAGGVCVRVPHRTGYHYEPGGIYSPDGHCRVFDASAQGVVFGNGVGIVVLKRLADALAANDCIHAVVKGSAINNDGFSKASYAAPGVDGQAAVIRQAHAAASVRAESISYVEAHGTGTAVGDPIEIAALKQAFGSRPRRRSRCAVGSVKTNFGHLDHAAGIAGFLKTVLALENKELPPSLHFETPNPAIDFAGSPFYVGSRLAAWKRTRLPRRAGVSAFGIGGTNAHVVLEEAPSRTRSGSLRGSHLLVLSGRTRSVLGRATANLVAHLKTHPEQGLADVAYTLQVGRRAFAHRRAVVCRDAADAVSALAPMDPGRVATAAGASRKRDVIFMFSGQGTQYVHMAAGLYRVEPTFREQVDRCAEILRPHLGLDLRRVLYPRGKQGNAADRLTQTAIAQPALFVVEFALAKMWLGWGVAPVAMIGHSVGEFVAACLAGVFTLDEALTLVAERGRLMQALPRGAMLAVPLPEAAIQPLLKGGLCLAAINDHAMCVVAGPTAAIDRLASRLAAKSVECRRLHTSHAFHSAMMNPMIKPFSEMIWRVRLQRPRLRFVSSVTGKWITPAQATSPTYWARHAREPVRFADGLATLLKEPDCLLLEVGPGQALSTFARRHPSRTPEQRVLSSLRHPHETCTDTEFILDTVGRLWIAGAPIDWPELHRHERRLRVSLPVYPFERKRFWIEPASPRDAERSRAVMKRPDVADWFYAPSWRRSVAFDAAADELLARHELRWLVFSDPWGVGSSLAQRLERQGQAVVSVMPGTAFARIGAHDYVVNPRRAEDYQALLSDLTARGLQPEMIVHLWSMTSVDREPSDLAHFHRCLERGFLSLVLLAKALAKSTVTVPVQIGVVSNGLHLVNGDERLVPAKSTLLGACKGIPQEYPNLRCQCIDILDPQCVMARGSRVCDHLIGELLQRSREGIVAYRGDFRWVQAFEPVRLSSPAEMPSLLREGGVYLIVGGLGNIGLVLAEELARTARARLILTGRGAFPARDDWAEWLATRPECDRLSRRIRKLQQIEQLGSTVMACSADLADNQAIENLVDRIYSRFGDLNGVIFGAGTVAPEAFVGIDQISRDVCDLHFHPKVRGLLGLAAALRGRRLDFWLLLSSLSAVLAGLGFAAYSAANSFLDAFAVAQNRASETPWLSVDWDAWELQENRALGAMVPAEGAETFRRILSQTALRHAVVSISDLDARLGQWINPELAAGAQDAEGLDAPLHERPDLDHEYVAPRDDVESAIADSWQRLLGVARVGVFDNFFTELGGHSLLAVQVVARLRSSFQVDIPPQRFMATPTVAALATAIAASRGKGNDDRAALHSRSATVVHLSHWHDARPAPAGPRTAGDSPAA